MYVSLLQADSTCQFTGRPDPNLLTIASTHFGHAKAVLRQSRRILAASHAPAVLLEMLQRDHSPLRILGSYPTASPARSYRPCCTDGAVSGLARVANSEGSHTIDTLAVSGQTPQRAARNIRSGGWVEGSMLFRHRLVPAIEPAPMPGIDCHRRDSAVVSGGLGGLGHLTGLWMTQQGCTSLVLLGRSGRGNPSLLETFASSEAEVTLLRCDVSVAAEVAGINGRDRITHVVHAGGMLRDGVLGSQTAAGLREVWAPKAQGLRNLAAAFGGGGATLVAFSSIAGVLGSAGQANYAAANAYMDAWAEAATQQVHLLCA